MFPKMTFSFMTSFSILSHFALRNTGRGTRWQSRRMYWSSTISTNTSKIHLYMEQFSQRKPTENWQKIFYTTKAAGKSPRNQEQQQGWHHDGSSTPRRTLWRREYAQEQALGWGGPSPCQTSTGEQIEELDGPGLCSQGECVTRSLENKI